MSMRVLLSERSFKGHRKTYMEFLLKVPNVEFYILAPENIGVPDDHYYKYSCNSEMKSTGAYLDWINRMRKIVRENHIDVLHILDGDSIMRWFGFGLGSIRTSKTIITYHHFFSGLTRRISYRLMCAGRRYCVAHTTAVERALKSCGLKRVDRCEYPAFGFDRISSRDSVECKTKYGVPTNVPTIGIIGGLNRYKNIIPFLETLRDLKEDFHLLICGKDSEISKEEICSAVEPYKDKVTLCIRRLSDEEYEQAIVASDIIFCIYGYEFDGASGPLTDGVCAEKFILSCRHGSLGEIVSQNLLGLSADSNNRSDMLKQTRLALSRAKDFKYSDIAQKYRLRLSPQGFQETYKKLYAGRKM